MLPKCMNVYKRDFQKAPSEGIGTVKSYAQISLQSLAE